MANEDFDYFRTRLHKISDNVQALDGRVLENSLKISVLEGRVSGMAAVMATGEQLKAAIDVMAHKLEVVHNDLKPIKKALGWAIALIVGAFFAALLGLVFKGGPP